MEAHAQDRAQRPQGSPFGEGQRPERARKR